MITLGGIGWFVFMPASAKAALVAAAALTILTALILALSVIVFLLVYIGPYRNPGWLSPGFAASLCLFGIAAFSTGEFLREAVRKPFVVYNVVLANQILPQQVETMRKEGYLQNGIWTKAYVREHYPQTIVNDRIDGQALLKLHRAERIDLGHVLFQHHCNDCHAKTEGYAAVGPLLCGRSREMVRSTVEHLHTVFFMPPWSGTPEEAELLTDYLMSISPPRPSGMHVGIATGEGK